MIIHLKENIDTSKIEELAVKSSSIALKSGNYTRLITSSSIKELPSYLEDFTMEFFTMDSDIQLSSKDYRKDIKEIDLETFKIGGNTNNTVLIGGPCSVESEEQINASAKHLISNGLKSLRAGCFKPRTTPYSFQGMGMEGLTLLVRMREKYGLKIVTEVRDSTHVDAVIEHSDVIQIGAKSMYDHGILKACGKQNKPVLLKRGFGTTLQEFVQCAEFILSSGNPNVILCERGLRTFETKTRFTLDLCGVAFLKEKVNLPIILDPSHAMGHAYGVPDLVRACTAMNVDGLLVEMHPNPKIAKSDANQQLNFKQFSEMKKTLDPIAKAVGKTII
jgi:3-deoxy-7-phosphoheptulonate synthase